MLVAVKSLCKKHLLYSYCTIYSTPLFEVINIQQFLSTCQIISKIKKYESFFTIMPNIGYFYSCSEVQINLPCPANPVIVHFLTKGKIGALLYNNHWVYSITTTPNNIFKPTD